MKYLYFFILALILVTVQVTVLSHFDTISNLNLFLVALVFVYVIFNTNTAIIFSLFLGMILDFYSYLPFFSHVLLMMITIFFVIFLAKNFFTDFSIYSALFITWLTTAFYFFLNWIFKYFLDFVNIIEVSVSMDQAQMIRLFWQLFFNTFLIGILFTITHLLSKRLNTVFLKKR